MSVAGALWFAVQEDLINTTSHSSSTKAEKHHSTSETSRTSGSTRTSDTFRTSDSTRTPDSSRTPDTSRTSDSTRTSDNSKTSDSTRTSDTSSLLDGLDDQFLYQSFHLNRQCLRFIIDFILHRLQKDIFTPSHHLTFTDAKILAALSFYTHGSLQKKISDRLEINDTSARKALNTVTKLLSDMSPDFITFPNSYNDRMGAAQAFKNISGIPHVVGILGFLHVKVNPPHGEEERYLNTLGYHSVMMQVIFDGDGNLLSLEQCCPGGTPEQTVWESSDIGKQFYTFQHGHTWVVGGRGLHGGHVLIPVEVSQVKSTAVERFNIAHARLYSRVQQVFGSLKSRFQCLRDLGSFQTLETVACTIKACCVLHNISKKFSVPLPLDFSLEPLHPPPKSGTSTTEQTLDYMEDTKQDMIQMFFGSNKD